MNKIVIVFVVIVSLLIVSAVLLLHFNSPCQAQNGFFCSAFSSGFNANYNDTLSFDIGQAISPYIYNLNVACTYGNFSPVAQTEYYQIGTLAHVVAAGAGAGGTPGGGGVGSRAGGSDNDREVLSLPCFDNNGNQISNLTPGSNFDVYIWASYTLNQGAVSSSNPATTVIAEKISTKTSTSKNNAICIGYCGSTVQTTNTTNAQNTTPTQQNKTYYIVINSSIMYINLPKANYSLYVNYTSSLMHTNTSGRTISGTSSGRLLFSSNSQIRDINMTAFSIATYRNVSMLIHFELGKLFINGTAYNITMIKYGGGGGSSKGLNSSVTVENQTFIITLNYTEPTNGNSYYNSNGIVLCLFPKAYSNAEAYFFDPTSISVYTYPLYGRC